MEVKVLRWLHEEEATGVQYLEVPHLCCVFLYLAYLTAQDSCFELKPLSFSPS